MGGAVTAAGVQLSNPLIYLLFIRSCEVIGWGSTLKSLDILEANEFYASEVLGFNSQIP